MNIVKFIEGSFSSEVEVVRSIDDDNYIFYSPSLFLNPNAPGGYSIAYIRANDTRIEVKHRPASLTSGGWGDVETADSVLPLVGDATIEGMEYDVSSLDVVYHKPTGNFLMAFSGKKYSEFKPDRDIFIGFANNDTLIFNLHLDQKKPIYQGVPSHAGEYDSNLVKKEAKRIKEVLK